MDMGRHGKAGDTMINEQQEDPQQQQQQSAQAHQRLARDYLPGRIQHMGTTWWARHPYTHGHVVELIYLHGFFQTTLRLPGAVYQDALAFWRWYHQAPPEEVLRHNIPAFERGGVLRGTYITTPYLRYAITYTPPEVAQQP